MPQKYIKRKTKPVATYGETGEENQIQWITKSVGTFTGGGGGGTGTVDTEMSDTSTNAVQNKVIKEYVDKADENLTKVMPTDINVDSNGNLILEHDGVEITGQKKLITPLIRKNYNVNVGEWETPLIWLNNNNKRSGTLTFGESSTRFKFEYWGDNNNQSICYLDIPTTTDEVTLYNIVTDQNVSTYLTKYATLDSSNSFNNLQTFSEVKVNSYLDINYPDIDIIRISENANGQLQFDFSRVGGGTTVLPPGSANNTATIITTENIAANVANKVDKVTGTSTYPRLYGITPTGEQQTYYTRDTETSATGGIAAYSSNNTLRTATPVSDNDAANKKYVDDVVAGIKAETVKVVEISDVPAEVTNGTLTDEQLTTLQSYDGNYIMFNHEKYYLQDKGHVEGYLTYTHTGYENNQMWLKSITITIATKTWVLNVVGVKPTVVLTQSDYDNLAAKDANTLYYIIG